MFICDISVLNKYGKQKIDDMLIKYNIDWRIMVVLLITEQILGVSQVRLTPFMQTDKGNVTRILQTMEKRGMIYRKTDTKDQRNNLCYLTDQSFKLLPKLKRILILWEKECFSGLTKEEIILFKKINKTITKNLVDEWK
jgi:DNA-binding MarR family transcriptional regulator